MIIRGKVWKFGDNIDTDLIISGQYLSQSDADFLAKHCFEALEPGWANKISRGDILVAGKNFGCGSSREHAPLALKAAGIEGIIAESYGAIFFRNAINLGITAVELENAVEEFEENHLVEIIIDKGEIRNLVTNKSYGFKPLPPMVLNILKSGGLIGYIKKNL